MAQVYRRVDSVTLNDLPNELLLLIFQDLDPSSLIGVSCLCRRINTVALTFLLFPKMDFSDCLSRLRANTLCFGLSDSLSFSSIPALRLSFSMRQPLDFFSCHFTEEYIREIEQVEKLFETGRQLQHVILRFRRCTAPMPTSCVAVDRLFWPLHRVQCRALAVYDSLPVTYDDGARFGGPVLSTLEDITISRAPFVLSDFFREWTISSMNSSTLTVVILECVDIRALLPSLTLPFLRKFTVRCPDLPLSHVTPFLSRHPTIQSLILRISFDDAELAPGSLPKVDDLSSTAECLSRLLSSPDSMQHLRSITCYNANISVPSIVPEANAVQTLFQSIALRTSITDLNIPLMNLNIESDAWLNINPRFEHLLTAITQLRIDLSPAADAEVRRRTIDSVVLFSKVKTLILWRGEWDGFARQLRQTCPRIERIVSNMRDILSRSGPL
ncbi:uncharacterized protein ARMOST_15817 [Armillaria ostoyae]|uniref:F-box domain-containing protein n=1 Tax=Armillaria ostoyae TaxID=47428 RepID=A0A284RUH4_ARMOS|nr:uncharacterized protein ARMOST_15817 [Armillaria ostoyae]